MSGYYGRLDANSYFRTIVTNVEPTAKQSWILHPWVPFLLPLVDLNTELMLTTRNVSVDGFIQSVSSQEPRVFLTIFNSIQSHQMSKWSVLIVKDIVSPLTELRTFRCIVKLVTQCRGL